MPAVTLDTRTDIKSTPEAKFGDFVIKSNTTVSGWKVSGSVAPKTPVVTKVRRAPCPRARKLPTISLY